MENKNLIIIKSTLLRFVRSFVAFMIVAVPATLEFLSQHPEIAQLIAKYVYWAIPLLGFLSSVLLAADKAYREINK